MLSLILERFFSAAPPSGFAVPPGIMVLRDGLVLVTLFLATALTYRVVPIRKPSRNLIFQGALLASVGWMLTCYAFAHIVQLFWHKSLYGALGGLIAILLWAYACAWSLLIGACWIARWSRK
jgi:membrane protein